MGLEPSSFQYVQRLVQERASIVLQDEKDYLVEARLIPLARAEGIESVDALLGRLKATRDPRLNDAVVDAMTTNETSFFRDLHPFVTLREHVLPELVKRRQTERSLSIWCAASSSGQEPFTIAMTLREHFPALATWNLKIVATDISDTMLTRCRDAHYSKLEVNRGLPAPLLAKYFNQDGADWVVKDEVRQLVEFRKLNLATAWSGLGQIDLIFMRNVLIYFNEETRRAIFERAAQVLRGDGFLFLGAAESIVNLSDSFERCSIEKTSFYRPKDYPR